MKDAISRNEKTMWQQTEKMMRTTLHTALLIALLLSVTGCASTQQYKSFPDQTRRLENPELCRIYVMRPDMFGTAWSFQVKDGDELIGIIAASGFLCWERVPGKITISSVAENTYTLDLVAEAGVAYYVIQHLAAGVGAARSELELVDEAGGMKALEMCMPPKTTHPQGR